LLALVVVAIALYAWNIGYSGVSTYYAASAVSMSRSPHAFLFGALDPAGTMTLDKLSGFLVPQALSVAVFGVHAWALSLPQVVEGVITLVAAYAIGMRWRGPAVAVATAAGVALTPMLAAMFGRPMEDGMLTMATVLAVLAAQRAAITGHGAWMLLAGLWIGVGFQAKMLQSWFIVPAVVLIALLGSATPLGRRLAWAAAGAGATIVASVAWITAMQLVPTGSRPYVDGTTDDSFFAMVFGYNGVDRLLPGLVPGSVPQLAAHAVGTQLVTRVGSTGHSIGKLLEPTLTTQVGWLDVLALAAVGLEAVLLVPALRRRVPASVTALLPRGALDRGMVAGLVVWIGVTALILSVAFVPHATYFAPMAPALALLAAAGAADGVRLARAGIPGWRLLAPGTALASCAWQLGIVLLGPRSLAWVAGPLAVLGVAGAVALLVLGDRAGARPVRSGRTGRTAALVAAATVATLLAPALWSSFVLGPGGGGSASDAYAGPRDTAATRSAAAQRTSTRAAAPRRAGQAPAGRTPAREARPVRPPALPRTPASRTPLLRAPFTAPHDLALTPQQQRLVAYTRARVAPGAPLFATDTLAIAVSVILTTHDEAEPMGGFSQQAPSPTLPQLRAAIGGGWLRFVLLSSPRTPHPPNTVVQRDRDWVRAHCTAVMHGRFRAASTQTQTLYDCRAAGS